MSIFGKKKETAPPVPPAPSSSGLNDIKSEINGNNNNAVGNNSIGGNELPPPPSTSMNSNVIPPPTAANNSNSQVPPPQTSSSVNQQNNESSTEEREFDEPLFKLEEFELPSLDDIEPSNSTSDNQTELFSNNNQNNITNSHQNSNEQLFNQEHHNSTFNDSTALHTFIPTKGLTTSKEETFFLTTNEFKHLLELVDLVKERVKTSAQRHMKITTIKAEEDIEYENIKKDFQFIEDKLYEIDSTIFER